MGLLATILAEVVIAALAPPRTPARKHVVNCNGTHCDHPGHEWFCLPRYVGHVDSSGRVYCNKHFRQRLGLQRR